MSVVLMLYLSKSANHEDMEPKQSSVDQKPKGQSEIIFINAGDELGRIRTRKQINGS